MSASQMDSLAHFHFCIFIFWPLFLSFLLFILLIDFIKAFFSSPLSLCFLL
jgi:hypothetical protein